MAKIKSGFLGERAIVLPAPIVDDYRESELGRLLYITDIGYYPHANFHFRKRTREEAKQFILIYCVEGEGWVETDLTKQKVITDQVVVLPKGKTHSYGSSTQNPWTIYWIHMDGDKAAFFAGGLEKPLLISTNKDSRIEERLKLFDEIFATLKNGYSRNNLEYSTTALFYFFGSLRYLSSYRASGDATSLSRQRDVAEEAIHFMRENIRKRLTLKEIADYVGFSASHFSALFQQKTGHSPLNYFIQLKIQEACHYIDFTDMKINQISQLVGFEDPFYFSRIFSKTMGISPDNYRKIKKG